MAPTNNPKVGCADRKGRKPSERGSKSKALARLSPMKKQLQSAKASANAHSFYSRLKEFQSKCLLMILCYLLFPFALLTNMDVVKTALYVCIRSQVTDVGETVSNDWSKVLNWVWRMEEANASYWTWERSWRHPQRPLQALWAVQAPQWAQGRRRE